MTFYGALILLKMFLFVNFHPALRYVIIVPILFRKINAEPNEVALIYHKVRGL